MVGGGGSSSGVTLTRLVPLVMTLQLSQMHEELCKFIFITVYVEVCVVSYIPDLPKSVPLNDSSTGQIFSIKPSYS